MNSVSKVIEDDIVYTPGRYFVGLGKSFLKFPLNWVVRTMHFFPPSNSGRHPTHSFVYQIIDFSNDDDELGGSTLQVQLNEGQSLSMDVSFYFRIDDSRIHELYRIAGINYAPLLVRKSQEIIKNVASQFVTTEFFSKREEITETMRFELNKQLYATYFVFVPICQLRNVLLPSQLETALIDKVIADQQKKTAETQRNVTIIQAETQVIQALAQANVSTILQVANSDAFQTVQNAQAAVRTPYPHFVTCADDCGFVQAKKLVIDAQNLAYANLKTKVAFNNTQLFNYLFTERISQAPASSTIYVGFDGSLVVKQT
jgi:regulator of protease activity HflC (stomatin/prohibitin superfamily)